ncbi:MAG TPA: hypothetical protein VGD78_10620, partial [Chthoniobacterales bacterium]
AGVQLDGERHELLGGGEAVNALEHDDGRAYARYDWVTTSACGGISHHYVKTSHANPAPKV